MTTRVRSIVLGLLTPAVLLAGAAVLLQSWRSRLPDPMALHWGVNGVDRLGSFGDHIVPFAILAALTCVPAMIFALVAKGSLRRGAVGLSAGIGAMMAGIAVGTTAVQLDVADARSVASPGAAIVIPLLVAVAVGGVATWLAGGDPHAPATQAVPADAARLQLPDGGAAVWVRRLPSIPLALPVVTLGLVGVLAVTMGVLTGDWRMLLLAAALAVMVLGLTSWRVRIDRNGLTLTSFLGWPRYEIGAGEIVRADVVGVEPFREFGGWGVRAGRGGRLGFVTRRGEGIEIERSNDRRVVVTVDDAARGAALLNTVAERSRVNPAD